MVDMLYVNANEMPRPGALGFLPLRRILRMTSFIRMLKIIKTLFVMVTLVLLDTSCGWLRIQGPTAHNAPVVIYKTRKDYRNLVTVQLSADGRTITAFPAPSDVAGQKPIQLENGYLLKRMVGDAYLSLTIDEYAGAGHTFSEEDLLQLVIDRDPYLEKYDCSGCSDMDTASINAIIRADRLNRCKSIK